MKIENIEVYGFQAALRGMRNPMESWAKSDSRFVLHVGGDVGALEEYSHAKNCSVFWDYTMIRATEWPLIGPEDMKLVLNLIRGGGAHRKFLRQIMVVWDISIPRMIWQEYDTYKVATVRNSCSTMHKLGSRDLDPCDLEGYEEEMDRPQLDLINRLGAAYRESKTPENLHRLKLRLTESFVQKSTCTFSYETGLKMFFDRHNHRMPEWSGPEGICSYIRKLPYMEKFIDTMMAEKTR